MKYMTKMRQGRERGRERGGEGGGGGGKEGGVHRVLDHTYPELSVARATLVCILKPFLRIILLNVAHSQILEKMCNFLIL